MADYTELLARLDSEGYIHSDTAERHRIASIIRDLTAQLEQTAVQLNRERDLRTTEETAHRKTIADLIAMTKDCKQERKSRGEAERSTKARFLGWMHQTKDEWWYPGRRDLYMSRQEMEKRQNEFEWKTDPGGTGFLWPFYNGYPMLYADERTELEMRAESAERRLAEVEQWLDSNTGFYNVDADYPVDAPNVPVLAQVSKRIWYHATNDETSCLFSAMMKRALAPVQNAVACSGDENRQPLGDSNDDNGTSDDRRKQEVRGESFSGGVSGRAGIASNAGNIHNKTDTRRKAGDGQGSGRIPDLKEASKRVAYLVQAENELCVFPPRYKNAVAAQERTLPRIGEQGPTVDASSPTAPAAAPTRSGPDSVICHAPGDKCLGCDHYYGKASVCKYAVPGYEHVPMGPVGTTYIGDTTLESILTQLGDHGPEFRLTALRVIGPLVEDAERHRYARALFSIDDVTLALDSMRGFTPTEEENLKYDATIDAARANKGRKNATS